MQALVIRWLGSSRRCQDLRNVPARGFASNSVQGGVMG